MLKYSQSNQSIYQSQSYILMSFASLLSKQSVRLSSLLTLALSSASNFLLLWSGKHFSDMKTLKQTISSFSKQKIWKWFPTIFSIMYERTLLPAALWWATSHRSAELGRPLINDVLNSLPKLNILFYLLHCYWIQLSRLTIFTFSMELIKLSHIFFFRFDYLQ